MSQIYAFSEDRCAMCGVIIPEGRMVCPKCEKGAKELPASYARAVPIYNNRINKAQHKSFWSKIFRF